jgi:hypothetical protein
VHLPEHCAVCGQKIEPDEAHKIVSKRQVFDLPETKLEVTKHQVGEVECCGQAQRGEYPGYVSSSVQYGPRVKPNENVTERQRRTKGLSDGARFPVRAVCGATCAPDCHASTAAGIYGANQ